jgi:enoyl reductase-like protein
MIEIAKHFTEQIDQHANTDVLHDIFASPRPFNENIALFDKWVSDHPKLEPAREYLFDFLLANQIESQRDKENYFDSPEWLEIEDKTLERGTELLNLILYISEAHENEVEIELNDFLNEFLLVDEDGFQDEHHIYEPVIDNEDLIDADQKEIASVLANYKDEELGELLRPMFFFFRSPYQKLEWNGLITPIEGAIYESLIKLNLSA